MPPRVFFLLIGTLDLIYSIRDHKMESLSRRDLSWEIVSTEEYEFTMEQLFFPFHAVI